MTENLLVTVSEWMAKGNIMEFVKADTSVNRAQLVCFSLRAYLCLLLTGA